MSIKPDCLWDEIALAGKKLCEKKQHDYGPHSISNTGNIGVAVRLNDKVTRLLTLIKKMEMGEDPNWESIHDTYTDIMNYAIIGKLLLDNKWADKVSMREIFGEDEDCERNYYTEAAEICDRVTRHMPIPATLGESRVRPILDLDDEVEYRGEGIATQETLPSNPYFDWSPYVGKRVRLLFTDSYVQRNVKIYADGVLSIGPLKKFVTLSNYQRFHVDSIRLVVLSGDSCLRDTVQRLSMLGE